MNIQIADYEDYRNYRIAKATEKRGGLTWSQWCDKIRDESRLKYLKERKNRKTKEVLAFLGGEENDDAVEDYHSQEWMKAMK